MAANDGTKVLEHTKGQNYTDVEYLDDFELDEVTEREERRGYGTYQQNP